MRSVLRQDPDAILIGEVRDSETVAAAETGHLVLFAPPSLERHRNGQPNHRLRSHVSATRKSADAGLLSSGLLERAKGRGRVPAIEVMMTTGRIADPRQGRGETIEEMISDGKWYGMLTFDQSLVSCFPDGSVTLAQATASQPHDLNLMLEKACLVMARR